MKRILSMLAYALAFIAALVLLGSPAYAADGEPVVSFSLSWPIIVGLVVSVVLPLLVGLVTKVVTSSAVKAVVLAALAAVTGLLTELGNAMTAGTTYNLGMGLVFALVSFLVAVGLHFGIYKPTTVATKLQEVGDNSAPGPNDSLD